MSIDCVKKSGKNVGDIDPLGKGNDSEVRFRIEKNVSAVHRIKLSSVKSLLPHFISKK